MRVIAVINQKGGVGKTTTTLNLAHALARQGYQVMAIDLDPQAHLTASLGLEERAQAGIDSVLLDEAPIREVARAVRERLLLVPAGERLGEVDRLNRGGAQRGWLLKQALADVARGLDIVLLDCPPSAGLLNMNALLASGELMIPVSGDFLALHGLAKLMGLIAHVEKTVKSPMKKWLVLTRYQTRRRLSREVRDKLLNYFPQQVLATPIRESVALAESPSFGQTIFEYQAKGHGAEDYMGLARDLITERMAQADAEPETQEAPD